MMTLTLLAVVITQFNTVDVSSFVNQRVTNAGDNFSSHRRSDSVLTNSTTRIVIPKTLFSFLLDFYNCKETSVSLLNSPLIFIIVKRFYEIIQTNDTFSTCSRFLSINPRKCLISSLLFLIFLSNLRFSSSKALIFVRSFA